MMNDGCALGPRNRTVRGWSGESDSQTRALPLEPLPLREGGWVPWHGCKGEARGVGI